MSIVKVNQLTKIYGKKDNQVKAVDNISFEIMEKEFVAIVGTSGSGKSTLLHCLGGLDTFNEGIVEIKGQDISKMTVEELTVFRRREIGFVFQQFNLISNLSVYENIILPLQLDNVQPNQEYVKRIIHSLGLEKKINFMPTQLSGGQQQRVAIARALCAKPAILLCDEPTGNLDSKTTEEVLDLLKKTATEFSRTIIMITHNEHIADSAERKIKLEDGKVVGDEKK